MIEVSIPGFAHLRLLHLLIDFNGTLAMKGALVPGAAWRLRKLAELLEVHVLTADTFGKASQELKDLPLKLTIAPPGDQAEAKLHYLRKLGETGVVAIGNGRNDARMVAEAALGIGLIQREGAAGTLLAAADIVALDVRDALDLLLHPMQLVATLRA
ncbi:MAG TPA: hypothetical protein P5016_19435 [Verrucomicrobiales bacterium]|nr:ATPase P [Verrucomicrobiae bacterium]HRX56695.1 hypothetical protein [Verrucomicrobiales bacterium]